MADPLPPRPAADRYRRPPTRRPLAALTLLGAAGALLTGCAAGPHGSASGRPEHPVRQIAARPTGAGRAVEPAAGRAPGQRRSPAAVPAQPRPVRVLAVAYSAPAPPAPPARAAAAPRAGTAERRPQPAPGRPAAPAAPVPQQRTAPADAPRGLPPQQPGVCELGRHYGGWPAGSPQEAACRAVYG